MIGNTFGEPGAVPVSDVCNGQQGEDVALMDSCTVTHAVIVGGPPEEEQRFAPACPPLGRGQAGTRSDTPVLLVVSPADGHIRL